MSGRGEASEERRRESVSEAQAAIKSLLDTGMSRNEMGFLLAQYGGAIGESSGRNIISKLERGMMKRPSGITISALKQILRERGLPNVLGEDEAPMLVCVSGEWVRFNPFLDLGKHRVGTVLVFRVEGREYRARVIRGELGGKALEPIPDGGKD